MTLPEVQRLAKLEEKVDGMREDVTEIKDILKNLDGRYASKLTEIIVYGLVSLIVLTVFGAIITSHVI
jgi:phage-related minor tail protein